MKVPMDRLLIAVLASACLTAFVGCGDTQQSALAESKAAAANTTSLPKAEGATARSDAKVAPSEKPAASAEPTDQASKPQSPNVTAPTVEARAATATNAAPPAIADITFDDIKFEMTKDEKFLRTMLTDRIRSLTGKPVRIRGYIHPSSILSGGATQFVLVRDNQECCFGPGAALFDCIMVYMKPGHTTDYTIHPVAVEGEFSIQEMIDNLTGLTGAIYRLDAHLVE